MPVHVKRAYDPPEAGDGTRVLVDRLWPRGVSRDHAALDDWLRDVAPSDELRRWYGHDPERFDEFARRYRAELEAAGEPLRRLRELAAAGTLTLVVGARDVEHSNGAVLAALLAE